MKKCEKDLLETFYDALKVGQVFGVCVFNDEDNSVVFDATPKFTIKFNTDSYNYLKEQLKEEGK